MDYHNNHDNPVGGEPKATKLEPETPFQRRKRQTRLLHAAASSNDAPAIAALSAQGADINATADVGPPGRTALHAATFSGHVEAVEALLACGAEVNVYDGRGMSPLHVAARMDRQRRRDRLDIIDALVAHGADVNAKMSDGCDVTPLHLALSARVVSALVAWGADINARTTVDETPLHIASSFGHIQAMQALVALGADTNALDVRGSTPLCAASEGRVPASAVIFISHGADVHVADYSGKTSFARGNKAMDLFLGCSVEAAFMRCPL